MVTLEIYLDIQERKKGGKKNQKHREKSGGNGSQVADNITEIQNLIGQE